MGGDQGRGRNRTPPFRVKGLLVRKGAPKAGEGQQCRWACTKRMRQLALIHCVTGYCLQCDSLLCPMATTCSHSGFVLISFVELPLLLLLIETWIGDVPKLQNCPSPKSGAMHFTPSLLYYPSTVLQRPNKHVPRREKNTSSSSDPN